jgi:hypothetical protein
VIRIERRPETQLSAEEDPNAFVDVQRQRSPTAEHVPEWP